jgi:hypothetical protein
VLVEHILTGGISDTTWRIVGTGEPPKSRIDRPVTYGTQPGASVTVIPPEPLVSGRQYRITLFSQLGTEKENVGTIDIFR